MKLRTLFISLLVFLGFSPSPSGAGGEHQFTYFKASFVWPGTACKKMECEKSPARFILECLSPNGKAQPTLHSDTIYEILRHHLEELMEYWPVLYTEDAGLSITHWEDEYKHHGTACSNEFTAEAYYISRAIDIAKFYSLNIDMALKNRNIVPNETETYSPVKIGEAVRERTGYIPYIVCEEIDGEHYLAKIAICFDFTAKNGKHCTGRVFCPGIPHVLFPPAL